jgi:hypothetical protein
MAQVGIFIGDLNAVAPILTNFFLVTYALTNLAAALLDVSGIPNWRPHFRYSHRYVSLLGCVLTLAAMTYLDYKFAIATIAIVVILYTYVTLFFKGGADWVDISYALSYQEALAALLRMRRRLQSNKYWRPAVLMVLPEGGPTVPPLAAIFGNVSKGAPLIAGRLKTASAPARIESRTPRQLLEGAYDCSSWSGC